MGRAKLNMELIKKEKARNTTYHMRKNTLKKKVYELATLCGIKATIIIYGPKQVAQQACPLEPEIFPDNRDEVLELINKYKGQSPEDRKNKTILLSHFSKHMIKEAEKDLTNRNTNLWTKYPTWDLRFNRFTENDLWRIVALLENNIENAKAKLGQMKTNNNGNNINCAYFQLQQPRMLTKKRSREFEEGNPTNKYRVTIDPHQAGSMRVPVPMPIQQQGFSFMNHYQDERMVNFGGNYVGGASNIVCNAHPFQGVYSYPTMAGTMNNITYMNNLLMEPPNYYGEGMPSTAQPLMENHPIRPRYAPRQMVVTSHPMVATSHQANAHDQFYQDRKW